MLSTVVDRGGKITPVKWVTKEDGSPLGIKLGSVYIISPPFKMWGWSIQNSKSDPLLMIAIPIAVKETFISFYIVCMNAKIGHHSAGHHSIIEYYLRNSEVIAAIRIIASDLRPMFKHIGREIKHAVSRLGKGKANKDSNRKRKLGRKGIDEDLVKICEEATDKILEAMSITDRTSITIGGREFFLSEGRMECGDKHIAEMELRYIKRLADISKWPLRAILWWGDVHLEVPTQKLIPATPTVIGLVERCQQAFVSYKMNSRRPKESLNGERGQTPDMGMGTEHAQRVTHMNIDGTANTVSVSDRHIDMSSSNPCRVSHVTGPDLSAPRNSAVLSHDLERFGGLAEDVPDEHDDPRSQGPTRGSRRGTWR